MQGAVALQGFNQTYNRGGTTNPLASGSSYLFANCSALTSLSFYATNLGAINFPTCLLYTSPSPRDRTRSRMPSSA